MRTIITVLLIAAGLGLRPGMARAQDAFTAPRYADKHQLLQYVDGAGRVQPVQTAAEWSVRRAHILENMQRVMGALREVGPAPLDVEVLETVQEPHYTRFKITYVAEVYGGVPDRVPAYLLIPKDLLPGEKAPAVLALHQTTAIGKAEPAGLGGKPNLHYGAELAHRGYVVLAPDYPGSRQQFGDYAVDPYALGYVSATMKGIVNHRRAVDLLQSIGEVDPNRIGVVGHSLGGHNALFVAAFDPRIRAIVTSCGFTSFERYYDGDLTGWSHAGYMPRVATEYGLDPARMPFDFTEVLASLAPRPVYISAPQRDSNFDMLGVIACVRAAQPVYEQVFGAGERLAYVLPNVEHDFPYHVRMDAYQFLDRWLRAE